MQMESEKQIPDWMKKKREGMDKEEAEQQKREHDQLTANRLIQSEASKFWKSLIESLKVAVDALPTIRLRGSLEAQGQEGIRIRIDREDNSPNMTYTDMFLAGDHIQCTGLSVGAYNLEFRAISNTEIGVISSRGENVMNVAQASEHVMRRMVDAL
jgi:hypothetical protein